MQAVSGDSAAATMTNFHGRLVDWTDFYSWARDGGYQEHELNRHDSRCLELVDAYLDELATAE